MRMSTRQPVVKLIQATLSMHGGVEKDKTFSLRKDCFCKAAHNRAENAYKKTLLLSTNQQAELGELAWPKSIQFIAH